MPKIICFSQVDSQIYGAVDVRQEKQRNRHSRLEFSQNQFIVIVHSTQRRQFQAVIIFSNAFIFFPVSTSRNAKVRHKADFQITADVYTPMFLCDLFNFFVLMFGFSSFSVCVDYSTFPHSHLCVLKNP